MFRVLLLSALLLIGRAVQAAPLAGEFASIDGVFCPLKRGAVSRFWWSIPHRNAASLVNTQICRRCMTLMANAVWWCLRSHRIPSIRNWKQQAKSKPSVR